MQRRLFLASAASLCLSSCSRGAKVKIGSRDSVEGRLLGEILIAHLEAKTKATVERRLGLGPTPVLYQAIQNGDVEIYPEYSGVAYRTLFQVDEPLDGQMYLEKLQEQWRTKCGAEWLPPLGFESNYVAVARADDPAFQAISTLSGASGDKTGFKIGFTTEFGEAPDGYAALKSRYQFPERGTPRREPIGQLYFSLAEKRVDIIFTTSTDPRIEAGKYRILEDDRKVFARNFCSFAMRSILATDHPEILAAIKQLSGKFDNKRMVQWIGEIELQKRPIADVAREAYSKLQLG